MEVEAEGLRTEPRSRLRPRTEADMKIEVEAEIGQVEGWLKARSA